MKLTSLKVGDSLLWRHRQTAEWENQAILPEKLSRYVTVIAVFDRYVKTDFGDYWLATGLNVDAACGCNRFCNCYGEVSQLDKAECG